MPNWCSNEIRIWCQNKEECNDMLKFLEGDVKEMVWVNGKDCEQVTHKVFCFNSIVPEPEEVEDWCDWRVQNWGTKWEPTVTLFNVSGTEISIDCDTAWSPADGIYDAIVDKFPEAEVSWFYREDGMRFAGWLGE